MLISLTTARVKPNERPAKALPDLRAASAQGDKAKAGGGGLLCSSGFHTQEQEPIDLERGWDWMQGG